MNKGIIFVAPLGARNKKEAIFKEIISLCPEGDFSSVLYLSPNRFVLGEAERDFFSYIRKELKRSAYIPFQSFTIKEFASNLHEMFGNETRISDLTRSLILCEMLGGEKIGYADLLSGLLYKIRHYIPGKDLAETKEEIREQFFEEKAAERAVQAIETLELYEDEMKEKGLIDPEGILKESITYIKEHINTEQRQQIKDLHLNPCPPSCFCKKAGGLEPQNPFPYSTLVIEGFFDPTPLELKFIKTLTEKAGKTFILVEEEAGFYRYLKKDSWQMTLKRLPGSTKREKSGYFSYPSMEDEINGIARHVKSLILEGTGPREIAVSFPMLSKYLPMLRRVFHKHGIPISIAEYDLSNRRPATTIEDMISCLENDYPGHNFLSFLTSPDLPAIPRVLREEAVTYSYRAGIVKGKESWLNIRDILLNSPQEKRSAEETAKINEFQEEIEKIIRMLEDIKDQKSLPAFIDAFESALERLGLFDSPAESTESPADKIKDRFSELRHFAEAYGANEKERFPGIERVGFYIRRIFKDLKGSDRSRDGVRVVPFELAAGLEAKALFFGGMTEGDFPSKPAIDPILPERIKKDLGMPYLEYYLDRQTRYFRRLLNLSKFDPHFSSPSAEGDKPFLPSPLLDWEEKISPPTINIHTEEEVLISNPAVRHSYNKSYIFLEGPPAFDKEALKSLRKKSGAMSGGFINVTDIDSFRKCPLRFYIERVLKLEADKPPRFEVESRLWGILAHRTMEHLFREGAIELEDMEKRLFQGLRKSLRQFPIGDFWERVAGEIFRRLVPMIIARETDLRMQGYSPYMVEKGIKTEVNGMRLKGKIDRVDLKRQESGVRSQESEYRTCLPDRQAQTEENSTLNPVILLDYKTGTADRDSLQLPLYAAMWANDRAETVEKTGVYSLRDGKVNWFPKRKSMEEYIQHAVETADTIIRDIKRGKFSAEPFKEQECRYCYHSPLCEKAR